MKAEYYQKPVELMGKTIEKMDVANPQIYGNFLAQTYYYVSHSTRMLAFGAGLMKRSDESHFRRFIKHISEESSHEILAERDLQDLGMKPTDFNHLPETHALWEPQYYKMLHQGPLTLMGYIIALEYFSCTHLPRVYARIQDAHGTKAGRFIKLHAEEDPDHIQKAIELTSTLSPEMQETILVNIMQTAKTYSLMLDTCIQSATDDTSSTLTEFRKRELFI